MSKHTPGPWQMREYTVARHWDVGMIQCCDIEGDDGNRIVANLPDYKYPGGDDQCEANARLIAAAPELLSALSDALIVMEAGAEVRHGKGWTAVANSPIAKARAAIAKATGESQ